MNTSITIKKLFNNISMRPIYVLSRLYNSSCDEEIDDIISHAIVPVKWWIDLWLMMEFTRTICYMRLQILKDTL